MRSPLGGETAMQRRCRGRALRWRGSQKQTRARPDRFAALARQYSEGPSAPRGGDLGQWPRGRMVPPFDQAVIRLKVGQVSGAVETKFGYHVILRKAVRP